MLSHTINILTQTRGRLCHPSESHPGGHFQQIPMSLTNWSLTWLCPRQTMRVHSELHSLLPHSLRAFVGHHRAMFICFMCSLGKHISNSTPKEFPAHSLSFPHCLWQSDESPGPPFSLLTKHPLESGNVLALCSLVFLFSILIMVRLQVFRIFPFAKLCGPDQITSLT